MKSIKCMIGRHQWLHYLPFMSGNPQMYEHYRQCKVCGKGQVGETLLGKWKTVK